MLVVSFSTHPKAGRSRYKNIRFWLILFWLKYCPNFYILEGLRNAVIQKIKSINLKAAYIENIRILRFRNVLASLVVLSIFSSCQKGVTSDPGTPSTPITSSTATSLPKTYSVDVIEANGIHDVQKFDLTYDTNGRILSLISTTSIALKIIYKYNSDKTYTTDEYEANALSIHKVFYLNNISLVDSTVQYDITLKDTITEKYLYNLNKQLVTLKDYTYTKARGSVLQGTFSFTYNNNGNLIKVASGSQITSYEYYPDLINNLPKNILFFQEDKNLVKTTTETNGLPGSIIITNHTYTFDSKNRISSEKSVFSNTSYVVIQSYTY